MIRVIWYHWYCIYHLISPAGTTVGSSAAPPVCSSHHILLRMYQLNLRIPTTIE